MGKQPIDLLMQPSWRIIDQSSLGPYFDAKQSFAMDDTLCASVGKGESPATARSWVHHRTIVLGIQDTRLPFLEDGVKLLEDEGYRVIVRNSGGLAVVLDEGVLNISLIFEDEKKGIDIDRGYEAMTELVRRMLRPHNAEIEAYEIKGSYCPAATISASAAENSRESHKDACGAEPRFRFTSAPIKAEANAPI